MVGIQYLFLIKTLVLKIIIKTKHILQQLLYTKMEKYQEYIEEALIQIQYLQRIIGLNIILLKKVNMIIIINMDI